MGTANPFIPSAKKSPAPALQASLSDIEAESKGAPKYKVVTRLNLATGGARPPFAPIIAPPDEMAPAGAAPGDAKKFVDLGPGYAPLPIYPAGAPASGGALPALGGTAAPFPVAGAAGVRPVVAPPSRVEPPRSILGGRQTLVGVVAVVLVGMATWLGLRQDGDAGEETAPAPAAVVSAPPPPVATPAPIAPAEPSDAFKLWARDLRIAGVAAGDPPRALLNGRLFRRGDLVDSQVGARFAAVDASGRELVFETPDGATLRVRY